MTNPISKEESYKQSFGLGTTLDVEKAKRALEHALDIRKFEIGLYWQRAAYFCALIAAAFAGYFAILGAEKLNDKEYLAFVVSCIGFTFTWAWFLVNRGSKQWQENWENHVDMLEDMIIGPLYKTLLHRPRDGQHLDERYITGPASISVSKINQWVSSFTLAVWIALVTHSLPSVNCFCEISPKYFYMAGMTALFATLMAFRAKTHLGAHTHVMTLRQTRIAGKDHEGKGY